MSPATKFHIFLREVRQKLVAEEPIRGLSETVVLDTPGKRAQPQDAWANRWSVPSDYPGLSSGLTRLRDTTFHWFPQTLFFLSCSGSSQAVGVQPSGSSQAESSQAVGVQPSRFQPSSWSQAESSQAVGVQPSRFQPSRVQPSCWSPAKQSPAKLLESQPSRFQPSSWSPAKQSPAKQLESSQAVWIPAKQRRSRIHTSPIISIRLGNISSSSRIHEESDHIDPTHQFQPSCRGPGSSQAVRVPAKQRRFRIHTSPITSIRLGNISSSSRIHEESDHIDPTHQFQPSCRGPGSSQAVRVPAKQRRFRDPYESDHIDPTRKHKFQFPDPRRVRSHRSDSPVPAKLSRSWFQPSREGPGSVTSPITSIRLRNLSSSSRIHEESDHIDPTHQSSSSSSSSSGSDSKRPKSVPDSTIRVRSYQSDSIPLFSLRFQVPSGPRLITSVWGSIRESRNPSVWCQRQQVPLRSSGRLFTDLPRRPTLRTVRIRVLN